LCHTPINEQFNASDITAVIRCEEQDGFRDFVRTSHLPQRHHAHDARLELFDLFLTQSHATEYRRVYWTRTDSIDTDLAVFQIDRPGTCKRPYCGGTRDVIKKLSGWKLIEKAENKKKSKHGAKYYRLSTGGIYYLINNRWRVVTGLLKILLQSYNDNVIFSLLLYPYLQRETVLKIEETPLIAKISLYLHHCCEEIESAIESIRKSFVPYVVQQVFLWNDVPGDDNHRLLEFLKNEFNFDWVDKAEVTKYGDRNNTIRISHRSNSVLIKLNDKRTKANMTFRNKEICEFDFSPGLEILYRTNQTTQELHVDFFSGRVKTLAADLILSLALRAVTESDIETLSKDSRYVGLLEQIKKNLDEKYHKLLDLKQNI
jgi:hypothetical protein